MEQARPVDKRLQDWWLPALSDMSLSLDWCPLGPRSHWPVASRQSPRDRLGAEISSTRQYRAPMKGGSERINCRQCLRDLLIDNFFSVVTVSAMLGKQIIVDASWKWLKLYKWVSQRAYCTSSGRSRQGHTSCKLTETVFRTPEGQDDFQEVQGEFAELPGVPGTLEENISAARRKCLMLGDTFS